MQKIEKFPAINRANPSKMARYSFLKEVDAIEFDDKSFNSKMKVKCLCPKCGPRHVMAFHWIGRGTSQKILPVL